MYVATENQKFTVSTIELKLRKLAAAKIESCYTSAKDKKALREATDFHFSRVADQLCQMANNLEQRKGVFAVTEKWSSSKHYFSVYTITNGEPCRFIPFSLYPLFGYEYQTRFPIPAYICASRAFGMSRVLDATEHLFQTLKNLTGVYAQIDCI